VGDYLRRNNISPEDVYVSSKWGYTYVANWNVELDEGEPHEIKDHSLEIFMKQVEETKTHIGTLSICIKCTLLHLTLGY
jgi:aryl-alcohol dehydrogenase-like predicted oxidoreductase